MKLQNLGHIVHPIFSLLSIFALKGEIIIKLIIMIIIIIIITIIVTIIIITTSRAVEMPHRHFLTNQEGRWARRGCP